METEDEFLDSFQKDIDIVIFCMQKATSIK